MDNNVTFKRVKSIVFGKQGILTYLIH